MYSTVNITAKQNEQTTYTNNNLIDSGGCPSSNNNKNVNGLNSFLSNKKFDSKNGYINNIKYSINDIIKNQLFLNNDINDIKDIDGNILVVCNGPKVSPYLRRRNHTDSRMTEWHTEWQSHFPDYIEKTYSKIDKEQYKSRRCDVDLNETTILEFQHSRMSELEASQRKNDWCRNGKKIIWIIDGGDSVDITDVIGHQTKFLEFQKDSWKYKSYINYKSIYIDIKGYIYKINPSDVRTDMIEVVNPVEKSEFIRALKENNVKILFPYIKISSTTIYIDQKGAGNGKTFNIVQLPDIPEFEHYDDLIYTTKAHSAKQVIFDEIKSQISRGLFTNIVFPKNNIMNKITFISESEDDTEEPIEEKNTKMTSKEFNKIETKQKKYVINFINNKLKKEGKIFIGTIDSLNCAIYNKNNKIKEGTDKFINIVRSIIDNDIKDKITYAGESVKFNKKTLIICDEMQDVHEDYMKALIKLAREKGVDIYVVGDKLQSISIKENAFTFLENPLPDIINTKRLDVLNISRRFTHHQLINFNCHMIPFDRFELPEPTPYQLDNSEGIALTFIEGQTIYNTEKDEDKINIEVDKLMKDYKKEVEENSRKPKDFLVVTPVISRNLLIDALHMAIREYWRDKNNDNDNDYKDKKYSFIHRSEEGSSIDLRESEESTRIVSIHSSKGDGRPVVFAIGITEQALKLFSGGERNLIFYSLLNVATTRQELKLYFRVEPNNDYIHEKIMKFIDINPIFDYCIQNITPSFNIKNNVRLTKTLLMHNWDSGWNELQDNIIIHTNNNSNELTEDNSLNIFAEKQNIDMKHHNIRYSLFYIINILTVFNTLLKEDDTIQKQPLYQILNKISTIHLEYCDTQKEYYKLLSNKEYKEILLPILKYKNKNGDYKTYSDLLKETILKVQNKIKLKLKLKTYEPFTFLELLVLYHLIEIYENRQYSTCNISDLYDIIDIYEKTDKNIKEKYISLHYEQINPIISEINKQYPNIKYLLNHPVYYEGHSTSYNVFKRFTILGIHEGSVIIFYIKPQLNDMNYKDVMYESIFNEYIIKNVQKLNKEGEPSNNYNKFNGKNILHCVLTLDNDNKPYYFDWKDLIDEQKDIIVNILKKNIISHYKSNNYQVYQFYKHYKHEYKETAKNEQGIISNIIDKYVLIQSEKTKFSKISFPTYIRDFLNEMKSNIKRAKKRNKITNVLEEYDNKDHFYSELNICIEDDIRRYLGIDEDN